MSSDACAGHVELGSFVVDVCTGTGPVGDSPTSELFLTVHIESSRVTGASGTGSTVVVAK